MSLDLNQVLADWSIPDGQLGARMIRGADGGDFVQLRVDLGVLQMHPDGRPDGASYRGYPSAQRWVSERLGLGQPVEEQDWQELQRELQQLNYRRLALYVVAEEAAALRSEGAARECFVRVLRDIDDCLQIVSLIEEHEESGMRPHAGIRPTLLLQRTRVLARLRSLEGRHEEAIEALHEGLEQLDQALATVGLDRETREQDAGILLLREMEHQLREQTGIHRTLRERLADAVESEDYEAAARLRDELRRRNRRPSA